MAAAGSPVCTPFCPANNYLAESGVRLFVVTRDHVEFVVSLIHPLLPPRRMLNLTRRNETRPEFIVAARRANIGQRLEK